ncbi:zinc-binding dehydrogenase [Pseudomonas sp. NY15364]|uniref:zinc-binding dehydrogenase n=1 Tax=Pseudomonas sp. NY15364 TaxID=3400353 RepID=UPI003A8672D6
MHATEHYLAWTWQGHADPMSLRQERLSIPPLNDNEVLVRNVAIGLNPVDWKVLAGELVDWAPGKVPGVDGAGVVEAVGAGVDRNWIGQRVAYHQSLAHEGSFAQYTVLNQRVLMCVPDELDLALAAALPCPGLTAWQALNKLPALPGASILIGGAGGSVGGYLVQLAVARQLEVTVLCNPRHFDALRQLGASHCIAGPWSADRDWQPHQRYAAVIDCIGSEHAELLVPSLRSNGHIVCIQGRLPQWPNPAFGRALSLHEVALGALHAHGDDQDWARLVHAGEAMLQSLAEGRLKAQPLRRANFLELPAQLEALRQRDFSGKPVILID